MASTFSGSPANTASTLPSRRLRTQPSTPRSQRLALDEGAVADALHAAAHDDVADDVHASSPASIRRAPVKREIDQRSTERM